LREEVIIIMIMIRQQLPALSAKKRKRKSSGCLKVVGKIVPVPIIQYGTRKKLNKEKQNVSKITM